MANYIITSGVNSVVITIDGRRTSFGAGGLHLYTPDPLGMTVYVYEVTGVFKGHGTPTEPRGSGDRIPLVIGVDAIEVNGITLFENADALFIALQAVFFLGKASSLILDSQRVDFFSELPDPSTGQGEYWVVDRPTGAWILGSRREAGIYKGVAGEWAYRGADVPYYLQDDQFTVRDSLNPSKQLGFEIAGVSAGQKRIASWQDKNITVADDIDLQAEALERQEDDEGTVGIHGDVDLAGVLLLRNSILKHDGVRFIPCLNQTIRSSVLAINNTNVLVTKIDQEINVQRLSVHKITVSYQWSLNSSSRDFRAVATFGGQRLQDALTPDEIHQQEAKDSGGADPNGRGTNQKYAFTKSYFTTPVSLGPNALVLQFAGVSNNNLASMWEANIEIEEMISVIGI